MSQLMLPFRINPCLVLLLCALTSGVSRAQAPLLAVPDSTRAAQDAERILQQEQQRLKQERERQEQQRPKSAIDPKSLSGENRKVPELGAKCRDMTQIVVNGAKHLPLAAQEKILANYVGKCLGVVEIEKLMSEITLWYVGQGFITTRVYLPSQDLSRGRLEILVLEGVLEKISVRDGGKNTVSVRNVFPGLNNKVLNLRDIEQGLDQINKLSSNDAKMQIEPGSQPGSSVLVVNNQAKRSFKVNTSFDNQGSEGTGKRQLGVGFSVDSPLGMNDFFSFTHRQAQPAERERRYSAADSVIYWLPYGYNTLSLNASHSRYVSSITTPTGREFAISGNADNVNLRLDRVVYRNQKTRLTLAAGVTTKDSKNYLVGELLAVSSRKLSVLDLDVNFTAAFAGGALGLDLGYTRGLRQFGALRDADGLADDVARAQFNKIKYGANFNRPFKLAEYEGGFSSQFSGQRAGHVLYGSEQILIGGIYSVRGFVNTTFSGDHGFTWRNDLSLRLPVQVMQQSATVKPYLAFDYGRVSQKSGGESNSLSGAALGVSVQMGPATWEIFSAKPLSVPSGSRREGASTYFRLGIAI